MVPIAGPAISAGVKTALRAQELYAGEAAEEQARHAQSRYLQFVSALDARLKRAPFVVLVLTQAEWLDGASGQSARPNRPTDSGASTRCTSDLLGCRYWRRPPPSRRGARAPHRWLAAPPMELSGLDAAATEELAMNSRASDSLRASQSGLCPTPKAISTAASSRPGPTGRGGRPNAGGEGRR